MSLSTELPTHFHAHPHPPRPGEIGLFKNLISAINDSGGCTADEYHGAKSHVRFDERRGAGRAKVRCELADLLLVNVPVGRPDLARLTWLQAKVTHDSDLHSSTTRRFGGSLEQWDLLRNRPAISGAASTFAPPEDLLSSAVLASVGSFGVFYPSAHGVYDMAYFAADCLDALNNNSGRSGTLVHELDYLEMRTTGTLHEVTSACCLAMFGDHLDRGTVGTPISDLMWAGDPSEATIRRNWLQGILAEASRALPSANQLLQNVLAGVDAPMQGEPVPIPARAIAVVASDGQLLRQPTTRSYGRR